MKYKISISGIPISFSGLTGWEVARLEWAGIIRDGKCLVLNAPDGKFPAFSWEKFGTAKTRPGMQTSIYNYYKPMLLTLYSHTLINQQEFKLDHT